VQRTPAAQDTIVQAPHPPSRSHELRVGAEGRQQRPRCSGPRR
jgi:hypothetical protein